MYLKFDFSSFFIIRKITITINLFMQNSLKEYFDLKCHIEQLCIKFNGIYSKYLDNVYLEYVKEYSKINDYDKLEYNFIINTHQILIKIRGQNGSYLYKNANVKKFHNYIIHNHYATISESFEAQTLFQLEERLKCIKQKIKLYETNEIFTELFKYYTNKIPLNCNLIVTAINESNLNDSEKELYIKQYYNGILNDIFLFGDQFVEYDANNILQFKNNLFTIIVKPYNTKGRYTNTRLPKYDILVNATHNAKKVASFDSDNDRGQVIEKIVDLLYQIYNDILDQ